MFLSGIPLNTSQDLYNVSQCLCLPFNTSPLLLFIPRAVQEMIQDLRVHLRGVKTRRGKILTAVNKTETPPSVVTVRRQGISFEISQKADQQDFKRKHLGKISWKIRTIKLCTCIGLICFEYFALGKE